MAKLNLKEQLLRQIVLILIGLFTLIPLILLIRLSLDTKMKAVPTDIHVLIPTQIGLGNFAQLWEKAYQGRSFLFLLKNSLIVSMGASLISLALGLQASFAIARFRFPGKSGLLRILLLGFFLPPVALMMPLYVLLTELGLRSTSMGLVLVYTSFVLPFMIWHMHSVFSGLPGELEEAAFLEGAGLGRTFWQISLPVSLPSLGVSMFLAFLLGYNEFALGWFFIEKSAKVTLAMALSSFVGTYQVEWPMISALALMMSLPVVILFLLIRRFLFKGMLFKTLGED